MRVHDYLEYWAGAAPDGVCMSDGARSWTYREANEWADRVATGLSDLGVGDGMRFGVLAKNCAEWLPIYYGAFKAGAVPVPLNFRLHPREWVYLLADSGATAVFAQSQYTDALDGVRSDLPAALGRFVVIDGNARAEGDGWLSLADLTDAADPGALAENLVPADHDLWQMYTSGTTGLPKGAVLTHAAIDANMIQARTALSINAGDNLILVMPLFHAGAAMSMVVAVASGSSMRIVADFDPAECVRMLDEEDITCVTFVPAMIQAMLVHVPDVRERRYEHLRLIAYGASPIAEETLRQAMEVFGCDFVQAFGQTESSAAITTLSADAHRRALAGETHLLGSCGRPLVGTEVAVVDAEGKPVATGEVGEIVARGPQIMRGYWNLPDATAATLAGGWLHTGDAGRLDDEGFLYVCDRIKDMIVSGGENIYPKEIEDVLYEMAGVAEAAVIGVPDDRWGETVKAVVVAKPGQALTEASVMDRCRGRLAGFKAPRSVDFVDGLPRNATGKVLKTVLREPYWQGRSRHVS
ncbi:MAG: class I adenylate-forming enzyme family protein [Acidimicrobiia bacterium]